MFSSSVVSGGCDCDDCDDCDDGDVAQRHRSDGRVDHAVRSCAQRHGGGCPGLQVVHPEPPLAGGTPPGHGLAQAAALRHDTHDLRPDLSAQQ